MYDKKQQHTFKTNRQRERRKKVGSASEVMSSIVTQRGNESVDVEKEAVCAGRQTMLSARRTNAIRPSKSRSKEGRGKASSTRENAIMEQSNTDRSMPSSGRCNRRMGDGRRSRMK